MKLTYYYYAFCIIKLIASLRLDSYKNKNVFFLKPFFKNVTDIKKERKKYFVNPFFYDGRKNKISIKYSNNEFDNIKYDNNNSYNYCYDKNKYDDKRKNSRKNMLYMNSSEKDNLLNENILKKKSNEKEIEQSLTPLNMDWVKVMNLIYSSNDIDATTLAFNAAMSAVEKKGCLSSMLDLIGTMKSKNIKPDLVSYKLVLSLCDKYHLADTAEILFEEMIENDKINPNYEIYAIMISCYAKMGNAYKAIEVFEKLRNDPFIEEMRSLNISSSTDNKENSNDLQTSIIQNELKENNNNTTENNNNIYDDKFKQISNQIKNVENYSSKIQYSEYANVIYACNISNLYEQGIKYFEELLKTGKYMPSIFVFENIFDLLSKNGDYEKSIEYYNNLKNDPNFKKNINVNILNNILKSLSIHNKINVAEDIWNNEFDELLLTPNNLSYQIMLKIYSNIDNYEKAFKLFKEMQINKLLNNKNILPFLYTIESTKNCGIYNYAIYVLRVAKLLNFKSNDLLMLYNNTMISCINSKKYDVIISLYAELINIQQKDTSFQININTLTFVLLAFKELDMKQDFTNLKNIIIQRNYKLPPLCSKIFSETEND
ncbi:PPR repeat protein [Plasmodium sp. gorilla clade G2]|uniref:PPR repeat protein n=1 Tax=Plasmodium sp. gorilla clade G2 TaxID=880535 RepID=UPI000D21E191|nr:PPR repeat protein [Plasmodium sp. gorilla clade G2]SOV18641.1 PPR repeat protein [Plasmodium sp. gorilla clade G2]